MKAYEAALSATSTAEAPWYIVPADDKHNAQLIVFPSDLRYFKEPQNVLPSGFLPCAKRELQKMRKLLSNKA